MEFSFDVNKALPHELSLIRSKDINLDKNTDHFHKNKDTQVKVNLLKIIDGMGGASGKAQHLRGSITSALKLKSSDHHLYLLKESNANNGLGCVIGMIKVGFKRLFLLDNYGQQHECQPLCVLDFYVHESKQRNGYGKRLFNHMLHSLQVHPHELAIDRPSVKFTNFLATHYSLDKPIQQVNNFLVFDSFFKDMAAVGGIDAKNRRSAPVNRKMISMSSYQEARCCTSTSLSRTQRSNHVLPDRTLTRQLSMLPPTRQPSLLPPIERTENIHDSHANSELQQPTIPDPSESQRNHSPKASNSEIQIRNFSRHSIKQNSLSYPTISCIKNNANDGGGIKRVQFKSNPDVYTLPSSSSSMRQEHLQLASLANPLCETIPKVESSANNVNENYTIDKVIARINRNKEKLGTSWNVFGVPSNCSFSSNPYGSMRSRGFPR